MLVSNSLSSDVCPFNSRVVGMEDIGNDILRVCTFVRKMKLNAVSHPDVIRLRLWIARIMSALLMMMMSPNGTMRVVRYVSPAPYSPHNPPPITALDIIRQNIPKRNKARSIPHDKVHG